jgi:hypothetical protein
VLLLLLLLLLMMVMGWGGRFEEKEKSVNIKEAGKERGEEHQTGCRRA